MCNRIIQYIIRTFFNNKIRKLKKSFSSVGDHFYIGKEFSVLNPQYTNIGENFKAMDRVRIEAIDNHYQQSFSPKIKIGENVTFCTDIHIGCINYVEIGDNCLFASRIFISDHQHGDTSLGMKDIKAIERPLISKGPVIIKENVWIGEGVAILNGITIGKNSIIGANSVVTKDLPENSVAVGNPARIIKTLQ